MPSLADAGPVLPPVARARAHLVEPAPQESATAVLGAAAVFAMAALVLAGSVILGPFWDVRSPPDAVAAAHPLN